MSLLKQLVSAADALPKIVKLILALPFLDIVWAAYRLIKSIVKTNPLGIVLGILLLVFGIPFLWLIDLIFIALNKPVLWLD